MRTVTGLKCRHHHLQRHLGRFHRLLAFFQDTEGSFQEDEIPEWALACKAPPPPVVRQPEVPFEEPEPLMKQEVFQGAARLQKGQQCYTCNQTYFFSGLAWTYCRAEPRRQDGKTAFGYELSNMMPINADLQQILQLQIKDRAFRKRLEMEYVKKMVELKYLRTSSMVRNNWKIGQRV
eukprot:5207149-Amphidinium_carterae.1